MMQVGFECVPLSLRDGRAGRIAGRVIRPTKAQEKSLEDLRAENSVLKNTVTETQQAVDALEQDISGAGEGKQSHKCKGEVSAGERERERPKGRAPIFQHGIIVSFRISGLEPGFEALDGPTAVAAEAAGKSAGSMRGGAANAATVPTCPEDYWTPGIEVVEGSEYVDRYGEISPVPQHDGTECFKWDNMLWSSEAHFKGVLAGKKVLSEVHSFASDCHFMLEESGQITRVGRTNLKGVVRVL
eukprot:scaffold7249_cov19-Tisochrysis_lutea.AAC.5